jgi:hypothetical protein
MALDVCHCYSTVVAQRTFVFFQPKVHFDMLIKAASFVGLISAGCTGITPDVDMCTVFVSIQ